MSETFVFIIIEVNAPLLSIIDKKDELIEVDKIPGLIIRFIFEQRSKAYIFKKQLLANVTFLKFAHI